LVIKSIRHTLLLDSINIVKNSHKLQIEVSEFETNFRQEVWSFFITFIEFSYPNFSFNSENSFPEIMIYVILKNFFIEKSRMLMTINKRVIE